MESMISSKSDMGTDIDDFIDEESGIKRKPKGPAKFIIPAIAVLWCFFQLAIAKWITISSVYARAIHLGFALLIVYMNYPALSKPVAGLKFLSEKNRIPVIDYFLGITASWSALYYIINYQEIVKRYGSPVMMDLIAGLTLVILLLEAARRVIGPALPLIAIFFCCYAFFGPYMPSVIAFKGISLNRFMGQMTMSTEGIYGIPLDVSTKIVFLFVLFGAMLEKAGGGEYFIKLALSLLGGFKGGPAKAAIVGSGLTGMVSGSSIANIVTTGTFTIPMMKKVGYPPTKAAAIEVAASTDGQLAPPIMGAAAFIIAEYVNVPYLEVVKAALIPAFASYAALFYISHIEASKLGLKGIPRKELPPFFGTFISGLHYLVPLSMLLYELIGLRHSPELAAFNAIELLALIILVQEPIKAYLNKEPLWPSIPKGISILLSSFASGGRNMVSVALATSAAGIIVGIVALGLGGLITDLIGALSMGNVFLMLIITALASLLIGMGLPTTATYIVMASLTARAIVDLGAINNFVTPLIASHLFCFYFGILADDTPPVGLAAYAAAAIAKSPPIATGIQGFLYDIRTAILPFMFIFNSDLILHNIHSWPTGILILVMACLANFAFASATQGWFLTRTKIWEIPLFLCVSFCLFRPDFLASLAGIDYAERHFMYLIGISLFGLLFLVHQIRIRTA